MGSNHKIDFKHLVDQMISGNISVEEKENLHHYIQNSYNDQELDYLMKEHWSGLKNEKTTSDDIQLLILKNNILSRIKQKEILKSKEHQLFNHGWKSYLMRVAAVLFIPLLLGSVFLYYMMNKQLDELSGTMVNQEVIASPGSRVHFTLPDKTEVWLNSKSKLEFPINLNHQQERIVKLTGQGYFKVAHDKEHPFFVATEGMNIKALGTSFDVSAYGDDNQISATLEEGAIALYSLNGKEVAQLNPGQKATLEKTSKVLNVSEVVTMYTTSWKDGKLIFRNTSLNDVAVQLERWFNCEIHLDPKLNKIELFYTGTIENETLGEVLKMIEISTSVKTKIEKREVYIGY